MLMNNNNGLCIMNDEFWKKNAMHVWLNFHNNIHSMVVQDWYRTIFYIEDPHPYPLTNGGQT